MIKLVKACGKSDDAIQTPPNARGRGFISGWASKGIEEF